MTLKLKIATTEDLDIILPMVKAYHHFEFMETDNDTRSQAIQTLLNNPQYGKIWLIQWEEKTVGYISLCPGYTIEFGGRDAFIDEFFILSDYRGKGLGNKTLELVKEKAREWGIKSLFLEVDKENIIAQNLYKKASFKPRDKYILMNVEL